MGCQADVAPVKGTDQPNFENLAIKADPTSTTRIYSIEEAILFQQDFDSGIGGIIAEMAGSWDMREEQNGNHVFCNSPIEEGWPSITLGNYAWSDYAFELRGKILEFNDDPAMSVTIRESQTTDDIWAYINFQEDFVELHTPDKGYSYNKFHNEENTWYTYRFEITGQQVKFFIDNEMAGSVENFSQTRGMAGFSVAPNTIACIDDIRIWALDNEGQAISAKSFNVPELEVVTDNAATGDGGNSWGGHQTRIVRTKDGVFTAYTVDGSGYFGKKWQLAWRQEDGTWPVIAEGDGGRDPINLLAAPDGTIYIISWPNQIATVWSGKPENGKIELKQERIPGLVETNWPYASAGISENGDLCVLASQGGDLPGGFFSWACYLPARGHWIQKNTQLDYRFCYSYLFPETDGGLSIVSTRAVRWEVLGYEQPPNSFDYVYDAIGYWHTEDLQIDPLKRLFQMEERPTPQFPWVHLNAQEDAFIDSFGNLHILYIVLGESTQGVYQNHHALISPEGKILRDVILPVEIGDFSRIFQNKNGKIFILGSYGALYPAGEDGFTLGEPIIIIQDSFLVEYSGFGISAPRTGTVTSNTLDVVFPSGKGKQWIYFQLKLPD